MNASLSSPRRFGLHTRVGLGVAAVVFAAALAIATIALQLVRGSLRASIAAEQFARVSAIASAVDQQLESRRILLRTFAESASARDLQDAAALQAFLGKHPSLRRAFDSVAFIGLDGDLVANLNDPKQNGKVNIADRAYFQRTVASGLGIISSPYRNRLSGLAQVAITEPVLDAQGKVRFIISGAINLKDRNILGELTDVRLGKSGYLFILTADGVVVDHPDASRILNRMQSGQGAGPEVQRALAGFEGSEEGLDEAGVPGLYAFVRTEQTNWIVGARYPSREAFARIDAIERGALGGALLLSLLGGALALVFVRRRLRPLAELHGRMQSAQDPSASATLPPETEADVRRDAHAQDEIGDLARTFDALMAQRRASELSLARSEAQVRTIADNIPAQVSRVDASLRYTFVNAHVKAMYGEHGGDLIGRSMPEARGAADFALVASCYERALRGETVIVEKAGNPERGVGDRTYKAHYIPDRDTQGTVQGVFAMTFDITDEVNTRKALIAQERRLRDVTNSIPALVGYFDREQNCLFANSRARRMANVGDGPLEGVTLRSALGEQVYAQQLPYLQAVLGGRSERFPIDAPFHDGEGHFQAHLVPDAGPDGQVQGFYLMAFNITALKEAELRAAESERRLRTITNNMPALITYIDCDERITFANATCREWLGLDPTEVEGRHLQEVAGREVYLTRRPMLARALAGETVEFEARTLREGHQRAIQVIYVPDTQIDGTTRGIFSLALDITGLKLVERQLIEQARVDTLTGLPNRLAFNEFLPDAVLRAQLAGHSLAVLFLDIDRFKEINDSGGHAAGDAVLVEYARRLKACVRAGDMAARLAGDEFVLAIEDLPSREAVATIAAEIVRQINGTAFLADGRRIEVATSIGIAFHGPSDGELTPAELLARADLALYEAKAAGRNRYAFFVPAANDSRAVGPVAQANAPGRDRSGGR